MKMRGLIGLAVCVIAVVGIAWAGTASAAPISIANGDFNNPSPGAYDAFAWGTVPSWTVTSAPLNGDYYAPQTTARVGWFPPATPYVQMDTWNGIVSVSQTLADVETPNTTYTFSVDSEVGPGYGHGNGNVTFQVLAGATPIITISVPDTALNSAISWYGDNFGTLTGTFTSGASVTGEPLTVVLSSATMTRIDVDNVKLDAVTTPEPATMALLAIGGIGALLRRRK